MVEIEKLIEKLRDAGWTNPGLTDKQSLEWDAATALEQLQAELRQVRVERDAYKIYFIAVSSKPDCNTCEKRGCEFRPRVGDTVRANCPLYSGPEKEE